MFSGSRISIGGVFKDRPVFSEEQILHDLVEKAGLSDIVILTDRRYTLNLLTILPIVVAAVAIGMVSLFLVTGLWRKTPIGRKLAKRRKRSPLPNDMKMLRPAGHSIRQKIDGLWDNFMFSFMLCTFSPAAAFLFCAFGGSRNLVSVAIVFGPMLLAGLIVSVRTFKQIQEYRLGLDGELATAEELNRLMRHGYHVFHDLPATDRFNIDHVVVGPAGVFAVETKMRSKRDYSGKKGALVRFEEDTLRFPSFQDTKAIEQARNQGKWLAKFVSKSVGKTIPVTPVVGLPGWYIERGRHDGSVLVYNPVNGEKLITNRPKVLDEQTVQQVAYQVDQRCRDLEPFNPV